MTMEEHMIMGGFGCFLREKCAEAGLKGPDRCFGVPETILTHGRHDLLMRDAGLLPAQMAERIEALLKGAGGE